MFAVCTSTHTYLYVGMEVEKEDREVVLRPERPAQPQGERAGTPGRGEVRGEGEEVDREVRDGINHIISNIAIFLPPNNGREIQLIFS